jgi:hypothetical protein
MTIILISTLVLQCVCIAGESSLLVAEVRVAYSLLDRLTLSILKILAWFKLLIFCSILFATMGDAAQP